jgi:hypothetical protein
MSSFPRSPRIVKGAIVSFDLPSPIPQVIIFQYNPETLTRSLYPQGRRTSEEEEGDRAETSRLKGAPIESISLDVSLDATDQLEHPDQNRTASTMGIGPQLSALEMILYPKLSGIVLNAALSALGVTQISPLEAPFTLFIWGPKRVLPVRLTELSVTEEAYDVNLNPIRARVSLGLHVLSYSDFKPDHVGYYVFMAHHTIKEVMSIAGSVNSISAVGSGDLRLF